MVHMRKKFVQHTALKNLRHILSISKQEINNRRFNVDDDEKKWYLQTKLRLYCVRPKINTNDGTDRWKLSIFYCKICFLEMIKLEIKSESHQLGLRHVASD